KAGYPALIIENETTLLFPDYPGNGLYQTLGNLMTNPHIGMLFIDFSTRQRVRVNGRAEILEDEAEAKARFGPSAQRMIRVQVQEILANCPRRIPLLQHPV
ncbi:MAG TPA: pyridoxamine 5'-phosphate oxidase family protein, partial [bacterium]|nr:pyridoxamine 5'-phosphate oxidase family protein [bacterium]